MSTDLIGVLVLVAVFVLSAMSGVNMGILAVVSAFLFGTVWLGHPAKEVLAGFPADMFVVLVAVTFLFGIARTNGTVDWLVHATVRAAGNRHGVVPWIMFLLAAALCATGAASPAAVAILAPIGITFAVRHRLSPLYVGLMAVNGAAAGSFAPTGILGGIVNSSLEANHLRVGGGALFVGTFAVNAAAAVITWLLFGRRRRGAPLSAVPQPDAIVPTAPALGIEQAATLVALVLMVVGTTLLGLDTGLFALTLAAVLALVFRSTAQRASKEIAWPVVMLVCGIVTYITLLQRLGLVDSLGEKIAMVGAPLVAALLICYVAGVVSAFASTTGILGALMPLAAPFLASGSIATTGMVIALAAAAVVVDASPFSTNGALVVANSPEGIRAETYRGLLRWGAGVCAIAPFAVWTVFVAI
ncbi:hypothetical protein PUR61_12285 [Streptomyces sp. BE20]|uniref:SLC13 family permease n=1 Tax=unclassified Streptomyces TaxID=2593676 RepID=UPI002E75BD47|nr:MULTISPECIES: SLC13 family permease [unclassified Streptomyces]MED7948853.1 hypothetical protein [Streptomyces sp. BE303]MEE1822963.1 hypothetical protein [Streptomyces sp. BE20]